MTDIGKLSTLLDDPEVRVLIFGLAHVGSAHPPSESGAPRLRAIAWQLAAVLPDLVDAVSPGGEVIDANRLAQELAEASSDDDRSAGAFGPRIY